MKSRFDTGVYYLPQMTPFSLSVITASAVARKKYVTDSGRVCGIYSGLTLRNEFYLSTQVPKTLEIVTNKETTRCRKVAIQGMHYILRKSLTEITAENVGVYRILQLFSENNDTAINKTSIKAISNYICGKGIQQEHLLTLAKSFPAGVLENMIICGIL